MAKELYGRSYLLDIELPRIKAWNKAISKHNKDSDKVRDNANKTTNSKTS